MRLPWGTLSDPAFQQIDLLLGELSAGIKRWHSVIRIVRRDAADQFALIQLSGHDGEVILMFCLCAALQVEPQIGFAARLVRTVAEEAGIGEDGPDVAIKFDLVLRPQRGGNTDE